MSMQWAHEASGEVEWEPEPFELPLVNPGSSRLPPKSPLPYNEDSSDGDDSGESGKRVIVIDLA